MPHQAIATLDEGIPGLGRALDPTAVSRFLVPLVEPRIGRARVVGVEVLKHRAGRRCALSYTLEGPRGRTRVFAKVYAKTRGDSVLSTMRALRERLPLDCALGIPRPLDYIPELRMLVTEFIEGAVCARGLLSDPGQHSTRTAAEAAAVLHRLELPPTRRWSPAKQVRETARWVESLPVALGSRGAALVATLATQEVELRSQPRVPIHRDFYPEQIIARDGVAYVLDWDDLRHGDTAVDIGNFLAHLTLRGLQGGRQAAAQQRSRRAFLAAYASQTDGSSPFPASVAFHEATSLLRLAGVYAVRPRWADRLPEPLLTAAEAAHRGD